MWLFCVFVFTDLGTESKYNAIFTDLYLTELYSAVVQLPYDISAAIICHFNKIRDM